jgi:hypothetical protein
MAEDHTLIIEAGRTERHYWMDLWRYRELFYFLGLARPPGALQADGDRCCLGTDPALLNDGGFHRRLRSSSRG